MSASPPLASPLADGPIVLVAAVADAGGSRAAAAALACAGADLDRASLLIDVGGRPPRPTLLASAAARRLEERLAGHLLRARVAARGQVCHLAVPADREGLEVAAAAAAAARGSLIAVHVPQTLFQPALGGAGPRPSAALLRADLRLDRPLVALVVRHLATRGLVVSVLKRRLPWVTERRALFGVLPPDQPAGLPAYIRRQLLSRRGDGDLVAPGGDRAPSRSGELVGGAPAGFR